MVQQVEILGELSDRGDNLAVQHPRCLTVDYSGIQVSAAGQSRPLQPFIVVLEVVRDLDGCGQSIEATGDPEPATVLIVHSQTENEPRNWEHVSSNVDAPHPRIELPHSIEAEGVARDPGDHGQEYLLEFR